MAKTTNKVECLHCGAVLRDGNTSPCPECGKNGRRILVDVAGEIDVAGHVTWEKRREFYERRPLALVSVIALTVGAPFLGLVLVGWAGVIAGLMLGAVAYWIGPLAITKVREIERGG
ncbi:MAG: hypothetical protein CV088_12835 [Nitrospira sp. LK70]|nr:hypothetical protein [Nitrospira sp. LK70]